MITSLAKLESLGRTRLSPNFFLRDFLYSEVSQIEGIANVREVLQGFLQKSL